MRIKYKLNTDWQTAKPKITESLRVAGFRTIQTFGYRFADLVPGLDCPHHEAEDCDCEIIVLLLHSKEFSSVSILGHCQNGRIEFSLTDCPNATAISEVIARAFLNAHRMLQTECQ